MIKNRIVSQLEKRRCTLLGVGPMSINCVDSVIELANEREVPIFLIASRRQVDTKNLAGGYVNNWTTEEFSEYVLNNDKRGMVILSRDHGGPWQNPKEIEAGLGLHLAMESAKKSYSKDIECGFECIHIDTSVDIHSQPTIDSSLHRVFELYEHCWREASKNGKKIIFEIGTEEQNGSTNSQEELEYTLNSMKVFCSKNKMPYPTFVVIQCGTKVLETRNVGSFDSPVRIANEIPSEIQLPKMLEICKKFNIYMKEHNADYLSDQAISWHPRLGIQAANVAPEFGVIETRAFVTLLEINNLNKLADEFLEHAYSSRKWEKWMQDNSNTSDRDKSIIAGHYVFSTPTCKDIKCRAQKELKKSNINIDEYLKAITKKAILRYLKGFRLTSY